MHPSSDPRDPKSDVVRANDRVKTRVLAGDKPGTTAGRHARPFASLPTTADVRLRTAAVVGSDANAPARAVSRGRAAAAPP